MRLLTPSLVVFGLALAPCAGAVALDPSEPVTFRQGVAGQTITQSVRLTRDIQASGRRGIVVAADDVVLDCAGHTISGDGTGHGVESIDHRNVTITNCVIEDFESGIYLALSDDRKEQLQSVDNVIRDNKLTANAHGVFLVWSHRATIADNQIVGQTASGITLTGNPILGNACSNDVTISGNEIAFNRRGLVSLCEYLPQERNVVTGNVFSHNGVASTDRFESQERIRYTSNIFDDNLTTVFLRYHGDHQAQAGEPRRFEVGVYGSDGQECSDFSVESVKADPDEPVSFSKNGHRIEGSFKPGRDGLYSLAIAVRGCGQGLIRQRFWFGSERSKTYYLGLGERNDGGTLVETPPAEPVRVYCTMWVEAGVAETPQEAGIAKITSVRSSMWSHYEGEPYEHFWGVEFDHTYSRRADAWVAIDGNHEKGRVRVAEEIGKGPFAYQRSDWLDLAVKYWGRVPDWTSEPGALSQVELSYLVSDAPVIESVSNRNVWVLSATSPRRSSAKASIVLKGKGATDLRVRMADATKQYRVSVDGVPCNRDSSCRFTQEGGLLAIDLELSEREQTIAIAGKANKKRKPGGL